MKELGINELFPKVVGCAMILLLPLKIQTDFFFVFGKMFINILYDVWDTFLSEFGPFRLFSCKYIACTYVWVFPPKGVDPANRFRDISVFLSGF